MLRYTLRVLGIPVLCIDTERFDPVEDEEEGPPLIEGGSSHNFERDFYPLSPTSHHEWEWEDKKKGFGFV